MKSKATKKKYWVTIPVGASTTVIVEADSLDEAKEKAIDTVQVPSLCHQCSRHIDLGDILIDDKDVDGGEEE